MSSTAAPTPPVDIKQEAIAALVLLLKASDPGLRLEAARAILQARRDGIA